MMLRAEPLSDLDQALDQWLDHGQHPERKKGDATERAVGQGEPH